MTYMGLRDISISLRKITVLPLYLRLKGRERRTMLMQSTVSFAFLREKRMLKRTPILVLSILLFCPLSVRAQGGTAQGIEQSAANQQQLYSPSISQKFYEIAYELANSKDAEGPQTEQAMAFLTAAIKLDSDAKGVRSLLI